MTGFSKKFQRLDMACPVHCISPGGEEQARTFGIKISTIKKAPPRHTVGKAKKGRWSFLKDIWRGVMLCWALLAVILLPLEEWEVPALPADAPVPLEEPAPGAPEQALPAEPDPSGQRPTVALTFDDGPRRSTTTALLDGLEERGVKATFFVIGEQLPGCEDILRRMDEAGHQIGIHTYDHVALTGLNAADFADQVDRTRAALKETLGHNDFLLRPPYGMVDAGVKKRAGCPIILWSVDPTDWDDKDTERIVDHVTSKAQDGDIILLHDIYPTSVEAALRIVDALHQRGFLFVTVAELAAQHGLTLEAGEVYRKLSS